MGSLQDLRPAPSKMSLTFAAFADEHTPSTLTTPAASRMASDDEDSDSEDSAGSASRKRHVRSGIAGMRQRHSQQQQEVIPGCHPDGPQLADNEHILAFEPDMSTMLNAMADGDDGDDEAYEPEAGGADLDLLSTAEEEAAAQSGSGAEDMPGFDPLLLQLWFLGAATLAAAERRLGGCAAGTFAVVEGTGTEDERRHSHASDDDVRLYTLLMRGGADGCRCHLVRRFDVDEFQLRGHPQCFSSLEEVAAFAAEASNLSAVPLQDLVATASSAASRLGAAPAFAVPRVVLTS